MKKLILFLFMFLVSVMTYAQAGTQTFSISAGAMFPMRNLADNNLSDSSSGAASSGYHIEASYDYQLTNNFGLGVDVEFNSAKYSLSKVKSFYSTLLDDTQKEITSTAGWTIGGIYLRYYLRLPLGNKVSWDIAPLIGAMGTYSPEYQISSKSFIPPGPHPTLTYTRQRGKAFSFAYGIETKINIKSGSHGFFFEGRAINSNATFKQITGTGYNGKKYDFPVKMNLMYITASMGYTYYF